jgi:ABC-2 type transport system ATP-binding protein
MPDPAVSIRGLTKVYKRGKRALDGIDLEIPQGEIFGLIGPNGAGKSTTIRILATLLKPTEGTASVLGKDVVNDSMDVRRIIAYLPEDAGAYERLSGREYLEFVATFYGGERAAIVERGAKVADLGPRLDDRVAEYSGGMKRRLLLARTLMTSPKLAILDEPTSALDVINAHHVRRQIRDMVKDGQTTAIVSSHNMLEIEFLCDRVGFIDKGRILGVGTPKDLKAQYSADNLEDVFLRMGHHG